MKSLILVISFVLATNSFSKTIKYPAVFATKISSSIVTFKHCLSEEECRSVGKEDGYDIEDLNFSPSLEKGKAIALAFGELGLGLLAGWYAAIASWFYFGASTKTIIGVAVGTSVTTTATPSLSDTLNPVVQWKMANVQATFHKKNLENDDVIVMEMNDEVKMDKFVRRLEKVLREIE